MQKRVYAGSNFYFVILPARMQAVQTIIALRAPLTTAWTRRRFGSQRRRVTLWA